MYLTTSQLYHPSPIRHHEAQSLVLLIVRWEFPVVYPYSRAERGHHGDRVVLGTANPITQPMMRTRHSSNSLACVDICGTRSPSCRVLWDKAWNQIDRGAVGNCSALDNGIGVGLALDRLSAVCVAAVAIL